MDMRIEYANHLGETLELGPESVYHYGKHTLFDAELAYEVENGSVGPLTRDPAERELPVMVQGSDGEDGLAARETCARCSQPTHRRVFPAQSA